ncbi:FecR domain-containing protein [Methylobacterium sp. WL9]|uniref:FecR domain-containing protein n=1 Tax=Methylobacterium sp. WL9 TaxID=2603898 RepID=UPI001650CD55|nr:FecR domain-containing protein [Methylobacterium sp. WL9]
MALCEDAPWRIAKASGEAWISGDTVRPASASDSTVLRAGDSIRTGRTGRVLLNRGAESILVTPNSAITLPGTGKAGISTVIQRAGTIALDVEQRNVQHFEVETPYLAAVVKGTRFRVALENGRAKVDVERGRVQVADFKTGESALVLPGQSARVGAGSEQGLQLSGRGTFSPIDHGAPRAPRVTPLDVPKGGLKPLPGSTPLRVAALPGAGEAGGLVRGTNGVPRIASPIGEITLDVHAATNGVARSERQGSMGSGRSTVWSTGDLNPGTNAGKNKATNSGNPVGAAEAILGATGVSRVSTNSSASTLTTTAADGGTVVAGSGRTTGSGNAASGTGNGNGGSTGAGSSGNGNGNGGSTGAGSSGNGNGNNGNGNGNGGSTGAGSSGNGNGNNGNGNGNGGSTGAGSNGNRRN